MPTCIHLHLSAAVVMVSHQEADKFRVFSYNLNLVFNRHKHSYTRLTKSKWKAGTTELIWVIVKKNSLHRLSFNWLSANSEMRITLICISLNHDALHYTQQKLNCIWSMKKPKPCLKLELDNCMHSFQNYLHGSTGSGRVFSGSGIWPKYGAGFGKTQNILTGFGIWLLPGSGIRQNLGTGCGIFWLVCREFGKASRPK